MEDNKLSVHHLYVHFPFCRSKCAYCGFYSIVPHSECFDSLYNGYLSSLEAELAYYSAEYDLSHLKTVFIGGGSPSFKSSFVADLHTILSRTLCPYKPSDEKAEKKTDIKSAQKSSADDFLSGISEFTTECNPTQVSHDFIETALAAGVNRFSMGVQSFSDDALRRFGRHQTADDVFCALDLFAAAHSLHPHFTVSIDLINHLLLSESDIEPEMTALRTVIDRYDFIKHISVYDLTFDEGSRIYKDKSLRRSFSHSENVSEYYWQRLSEIMSAAGFIRYEVSNWARPGYECRHNLGYWHYDDYIGLGPAAHSTVGDLRIENIRDVSSYISDWQSSRSVTRLTKTEQAEEYLLMNLRLPNNPINTDIAKLIPHSLEHYQKLGWLTHNCAVTALGLDYLNTMLVDMFEELNK
jgi:oxygen-independent coproporphyrinogen-3 oxidase